MHATILGLTGTEVVLVLAVIFIVFAFNKIIDLAKALGSALRAFRTGVGEGIKVAQQKGTERESSGTEPAPKPATAESCTECNGSGHVTCGDCNGSGFVKVLITNCPEVFEATKIIIGYNPLNCGRCNGSGEIECSSCGGSR